MANPDSIRAGISDDTRPIRLYYLDWLRIFSMLTVFLYHNNRFFDSGDWHIKNAQLSQTSTVIENSLNLWIMPILFVLSGAAVFYSLKSRGAREFGKERFLRIFVPLVTLGMFVFGPLQIYFERLTHGDFTGSFWQFLPHYFDGFYAFGGNFAWMGVHLWYLMLLFAYSMMFLPLFLPARKGGTSWISRVSSVFDRPWALLLLFVPLALASHLTDALGMGFTRSMGGWDMFSYVLFFVYGYLLFSNPRIGATMRKYCFVSLALALASIGSWLIIRFAILPSPDTGFFFRTELRPLASWLWILALLGLSGRYLNSNSKILSYTNEAVLPFYILHQPVILSIGFFVVQWALPIGSKHLIVAGSSFLVITVLYEVVVRRANFLRFLFGMRQRKPRAALAASAGG